MRMKEAEAAQILRHGPLDPILEANPFPDETDACCRFSLPFVSVGQMLLTLET